MIFELPGIQTNISGITYGVVGLIVATRLIAKLSQGPNLDAFPTVGSSTWLGSWWAGFRYLANAQSIIQEGYEKYKFAPFKVAEPHRWIVVVSNHIHLEELARAPGNVLSLLEAINDQIQAEHTIGPEVHHNPYHISIIRSHLTPRRIEVLYPEIRDEIVLSFAEVLDLRGNEWKSVPALSTIEKIAYRATNRVFVGLPLCRDGDWIDLNIELNMATVKASTIVRLLPKSTRRLAARFTNVTRCIKLGAELLRPLIEERLKYRNEYGAEWDSMPDDLLSWLMAATECSELTPERLAARVLAVNLAANFSTSHSFTEALFYLAANPQYIQPLREEVEGIIEKEGWSKAALGKMRKVDSFLKECQRIDGRAIVTLARKALEDFTFSDGTFVPKGTSIAAATRSLHYDKRFYKNPEEFKPFRFAHLCEEDGNDSKHQFTSTTTEYLPFGHGKYACPGRFLAVAELKAMLAHVVVTYDVKLEDNATCPASVRIGSLTIADARAKVMFRKRVD